MHLPFTRTWTILPLLKSTHGQHRIPFFSRVTQSKLEANRPKGSWVVIRKKDRQTNRDFNFIYWYTCMMSEELYYIDLNQFSSIPGWAVSKYSVENWIKAVVGGRKNPEQFLNSEIYWVGGFGVKPEPNHTTWISLIRLIYAQLVWSINRNLYSISKGFL